MESVLNEQLQFGNNPENSKYRVIGVFEDYNRTSLKTGVEPTAFFYDEAASNTILALNGLDYASTLASVEGVWNSFFPDSPFNYSFLDERFEELYLEDKKLGWIFANFAFIAIVVALLGLFGLSSLISIQRTKEVGIRKILGASPLGIVFLFFKDFILLIVGATFIGGPIVFFTMNEWLLGYAYRINFPWWVLIAAFGLVVLMTFLTVGLQSYKAAIINPAKTLRHE